MSNLTELKDLTRRSFLSIAPIGALVALLGLKAAGPSSKDVRQDMIVASDFPDNKVYFDPSSKGEAGTAYPIGTRQHPSNNENDLYAICVASNIRHICGLYGTLVLNHDYSDVANPGWTFEGASPMSFAVDENSKPVNWSTFRNLLLKGTHIPISADFYAYDCASKNHFASAGTWRDKTILAGDNSARGYLNDSPDGDWFAEVVTMTAGAAGNPIPAPTYSIGKGLLYINSLSGSLIVKNMNHAQAECTIFCEPGAVVTLDNTNTAGIFRIYGAGQLINNSQGTTVDDQTDITLAQRAVYGDMGSQGVTLVFPGKYSTMNVGWWLWIPTLVCSSGGYIENYTSENGDKISYQVYLRAGTYSMLVQHYRGANRGKADIAVDGVVWYSADSYAATGIPRVIESTTGKIVAASGLKTVTVTLNGKNPLSNDYYFLLELLAFIKTA